MELKQWELEFIKQLMYKESGFVVDENKQFTVETRLRHLAKSEGLSSASEVIGKLRAGKDPALVHKLVDHMTNHETLFFRDPYLFEALKDSIFPTLFDARGTKRTINIWSCACSSGQEAYSIAILLHEHFPQVASWDINILATDVSDEMIRRTGDGLYSKVEIERGLDEKLRKKYFDPKGDQFQVVQKLRKHITCRKVNLAEPLPHLKNMDLVLLRNVLIYFDIKTKQHVLGQVRHVIANDGYLVLGGGESTMNIDDRYEKVQHGRAIFYQRGKDSSVASQSSPKLAVGG